MAGSTFEIFDSGDDDGAETDPYMIEEDPYMVVTPPPAVAKTDPYMVETPPPAVAYMRSSHIRRWSTNSWPCVQGALARACLQAGMQYIGVFRKAEHASGLINVLNRAAVELIRRNGTALYEQDLAPCLEDHFKELIEELNAQDAAVSEEEDNQ